MKRFLYCLFGVLLISLTSCGNNKTVTKSINYLNNNDACLYTFCSEGKTFNSLKYYNNINSISDIQISHAYTCIVFDVTNDSFCLSKENLNELYGLFKCDSYLWISFYGIKDSSFFVDTFFDNEKHYFDFRASALFSWYNYGKNDYVNVTGYASYADEYTNVFYQEIVIDFYSYAIKSVLGSM
ncbi:MAG: hypothetical protein PUC70_00960 [bacterium]|nr:hypothetical protein [bacterium]